MDRYSPINGVKLLIVVILGFNKITILSVFVPSLMTTTGFEDMVGTVAVIVVAVCVKERDIPPIVSVVIVFNFTPVIVMVSPIFTEDGEIELMYGFKVRVELGLSIPSLMTTLGSVVTVGTSTVIVVAVFVIVVQVIPPIVRVVTVFNKSPVMVIVSPGFTEDGVILAIESVKSLMYEIKLWLLNPI